MVDAMRRAMICIATVVAVAAGTSGIASGATSTSTTTSPASPPTTVQIRRAVASAERSSYLWATINICRSHLRRGGLVGVRGEMGALGFRSTLTMTVQLRQYNRARRAFLAVKAPTATRTVTLGALDTGIHQDGAEFHYAADTGLLDATVTFAWTRDGHRLGEVTRTTTSGHHDAAFAEPTGHSADSCRL
jgi:hypothetical protein